MKKGVAFKTIRVVLVLGIALAISMLLVRFSPKAERQIPVDIGRLVEVMPVKAETLTMTVESYGTVQPREVLKLVAEVRGQIVDIHPSFKEGGFIQKGSVLIRIDPRNYQLEVERRRVQVSQAQAELRRLQQEVLNLVASIKIAKSDVALAQKEVVRLKTLSGKKVVAQTTLDQAEQRYLASLERLQGFENQLALTGPFKEQFEAQRDMAEVLLRQAGLDLERSSIVAPFNAWVLERSIEKGQHVNSVPVYAAQQLSVVYVLAFFNTPFQNPGIERGHDTRSLKVQPGLTKHYFGHITLGLILLLERPRQCQLVFKTLEAFETDQIALLGLIKCRLGNDLFTAESF